MVIKFKTSGPFFGYKLPISGPLLDYHLHFNTAFRNSFGRSPSSYRSSLDKETIEIDAEFKKVFLDTNHPYWIEAKKRWNEEKPEINQKSLEFNIYEKAKIQEETLNKAIKTLENLKNKI